MECKRLLIGLMFMLSIGMSGCAIAGFQTVKVTVVDGEGKPVHGANTVFSFAGSSEISNKSGVTDESGVVKVIADPAIWVGISVNKNGYYTSSRKVSGSGNLNVTIPVRKILDPVSMYVKEAVLYFPKKGEEIGFDFEKGDFVSPYGEGENAQVYFKVQGGKKGDGSISGSLAMNFSKAEEGIQELYRLHQYSEFKYPYLAPENGYKPRLVLNYEYKLGRTDLSSLKEGNGSKPEGYVFKVVKQGGGGQDDESYYGKVLGDLSWSPVSSERKQSAGFLAFTYYYNPIASSRSLEFDQSNNRFRHEGAPFPP